MKKIIFIHLIWSLTVIIISTILLIAFISMYNPLSPYELFLPIVYIPIFSLLIIHQIIYNIFFFLSLKKSSEHIENTKTVKRCFPKWQKVTVIISRIAIASISVVLLLWFGSSFIISSSYQKGISEYLLLKNFYQENNSEYILDSEDYHDFAALFPMISYGTSKTYTCKNENEDKKIYISAYVLEKLPDGIINQCYSQSSLINSEKVIYINDSANREKIAVPFEKDGFSGFYTVNKSMQDQKSTDIAVKANGVFVKINITFSDAEDFADIDMDKATLVVCNLTNAICSDSLYSPKSALIDFYSEYGK